MNAEMSADEIVQWMRGLAFAQGYGACDAAAELIESLQAQLSGKTAIIDVNKSLLDAAIAESKRLNQELEASQRREKAAVEEIEAFTKARMQQLTLEQALVLQPVLNRIYTIRKRGPQEAGEGD